MNKQPDVKIIKCLSGETEWLEFQVYCDGEYITVAGTGVDTTRSIWSRERRTTHAFDPVEYVSDDGNATSDNPIFSTYVERDDTLHAKAGGYDITQQFTVVGDGQIHANVSCTSPNDDRIEKLMSGLYFIPHGKRARTYDILDFAWLPNLHLKEEHVCGHHFFRSPAVVVATGGYYLAIIPKIEEISSSGLPYALDLRSIDSIAEAPVLKYGICAWEPDGHVYSIHKRGTPIAHSTEFGFSYTILLGAYKHIYEVSQKITSFLWSTYGDKYFQDIRPQVMPFEEYGQRYTYRYELRDLLKYDSTGTLAGLNNKTRRGANFHAWENDLNVAYGIKHYGEKWQDKQLSRDADAIKNTVIKSPEEKGAFPCVFNFETEIYEGSLFWTARAADPINGYDAAAMGVTAWWALHWYNHFGTDGTDEALLKKLLEYCEFLANSQEPSGAIPTYFFSDLSPAEQLRESATSCISGAVLAKCAAISGDDNLKQAAIRCGNFTVSKIIPGLYFNDFETYYSCSPKPLYAIDYYTGIRPHCNLSIQWACDQMLALYHLTDDKAWLSHGEYLVSILSLYQQIWNPPFYPEYLYGGFGVMNTDGEWNDGRQARFVPTYADYYLATGKTQYLKRAVAACRASFALMDMKENHEQGINSLVFGEDFRANGAEHGEPGRGYAPENVHHNAVLDPSGHSSFSCWTGMNWSAGGGLAASAYLEHYFGTAHISTENMELICIDGLEGTIKSDAEGKISVEIKEAFQDMSAGRRVKITASSRDDITVNGALVNFSPNFPVEIVL